MALGTMTLALGAACVGAPSVNRSSDDRPPATEAPTTAFVPALEETLGDGRYDDVRAARTTSCPRTCPETS